MASIGLLKKKQNKTYKITVLRGIIMKQFIKRLFCGHKYYQISWYEEYDSYRNERYSMRLYQCKKCGKEIWVDGRCDTFNI